MDKMYEVYEKLIADFPPESYTIDRSRGGVTLIGIRGAFIVERLNEVFGLLGVGWRYAIGEYVLHERDGKGKEITVDIALQYLLPEDCRETACAPVHWDVNSWYFEEMPQESRVWSQPVWGTGGNAVIGGGVPNSDARKGAVSDALSKAASRIGVGLNAYKGMLEVDGQEVVIKGELGLVTQLRETKDLLYAVLTSLRKTSPAAYKPLMIHDEVARHFVVTVLDPLAAYIKEMGLSKFVQDNYKELVGNPKLEGFTSMTLDEATTLADIVYSIVQKEVTWQDALSVAQKIPEHKAWKAALAAWKANASDTDK